MENKLIRYIRLKLFSPYCIYGELSSVLPNSKQEAERKTLTVGDIINTMTDTTDYRWREVYKEMKWGYRAHLFNKVRVGKEVYYYNA